MLNIYRSLKSKIIRRIFFEVKQLELQSKLTKWHENVTSYSSRFSDEASVLNHSNDKGNIVISKESFVRGHLRVLKYGGKIEIGCYSYIGIYSQIWSGNNVKVGNNVLIADHVFISDTNSHEINYKEREESYHKMLQTGTVEFMGKIKTAPIEINDNVWIGYGSIILKGVKIGSRSIIGAGSVVKDDVEEDCFYSGNPAVLVKRLI